MEKQVIENTSQSSVELNKTAKGDRSWSIKVYGWDEEDCATRALRLDRVLELEYGKNTSQEQG